MGKMETYELDRNLGKEELLKQILEKKRHYQNRINTSTAEKQLKAEKCMDEVQDILKIVEAMDASLPNFGAEAERLINAHFHTEEPEKTYSRPIEMPPPKTWEQRAQQTYRRPEVKPEAVPGASEQHIHQTYASTAQQQGQPAQSAYTNTQQQQGQIHLRQVYTSTTQQQARPAQQVQTRTATQPEKPRKKSLPDRLDRLVSFALTIFMLMLVVRALRSCSTYIHGGSNDQKSSIAGTVQRGVDPKEVNDKDATPAEDFEYSIDNNLGVIISGYTGNEPVVVIPSAIEETVVYGIRDNAFEEKTWITDVIVKEGTAYIGANAFYGCKSLQRISLPGTLIGIREGAFRECISLTEVEIPEGVTELYYDAFRECRSMTFVSIPGSVGTIGRSAFRDCVSLQRFTWGKSDMNYANQVVENEAFRGCTSLAEVYLNGTVSGVGNSAFRECPALVSFEWVASDAVYADQSLGESALAENENLTYVYLSGQVGEIGYSVFSGSENVTVHTTAGSVAESYARKQEIPVILE